MARFFDGENKYPLIMVLIICFFVGLVTIALILSRLKLTEKTDGTIADIIQDGELVINYVDGDIIEFNDNKEHKYGITITNIGNEKVFYSIYLDNCSKQNVTVKIFDNTGKMINEINNNATSKRIINLDNINEGETLRFTLSVTTKKTKRFNGTIKVVNESTSTQTFSDLILLNNNVVAPKTQIGKETATTNEGLISTIDNKGRSYYFRGKIDNNYVKIGDYLFRIVRINGDSSVRLVLNGALEEKLPYNTKAINSEDIYEQVLYQNSSLLEELNHWYETKLYEYSQHIIDGDFCTDKTFTNEINGIRYSSAFTRIYNNYEPSLYCNGEIYSGKIGLLSADEVILAGATINDSNEQFYLYNNDINDSFITTSSYFINSEGNVVMMNVLPNGKLGEGVLKTTSIYIRPVINISINSRVKGEGTINNPYIIVS